MRENRFTVRDALLLFILTTAAVLLVSSCGARDRAPDGEQPRAEETPAPVLLIIPSVREEAARTAWAMLLREQGIVPRESPPALNLSPVTKTITTLPALPAPLRLPRVGDSAATGEQRTANERESLRRFINLNATLTGATGDTLTLVGTDDLANDAWRARYEQRPFVYPLRGGYGHIVIDYTTDGRVLNLMSTALPEATSVDGPLRALRARLTADEARAALAGKSVELQNDAGTSLQRTLPGDEETLRQRVRATELVIYPAPLPSAGEEGRLELHLAWELRVEDAGEAYFVYLDATSGEVLGATPAGGDRRS